MKHRPVVSLKSAPDARPEPRVRLHQLSSEVQALANRLGIWDGDTIPQVRRRIEEHLLMLNDEQRRNLLAAIASAAL